MLTARNRTIRRTSRAGFVGICVGVCGSWKPNDPPDKPGGIRDTVTLRCMTGLSVHATNATDRADLLGCLDEVGVASYRAQKIPATFTSMKYRELTVLLPCHSLEDFPLYHVDEDADSLLACWTALWHPTLVATSGSTPKWYRVDMPADDLKDSLILVPTVSMPQLPSGFAQRAKDAGAVLICRETDRQTILQKALQPLEGVSGMALATGGTAMCVVPPGASALPLTKTDGADEIDPELTADFLALGYAYLQIQILTRQMRYSSNLDETHFFNQFLAGANAAHLGQVEEARARLMSCFDLLAEERDHYYSVDAYLLDFTLLADSTLGATLRDELARGTPLNLLLSGEVLDLMAKREPETLRALTAAIQEQRVGIVGGEWNTRPLPLISLEGILAELRRGQAKYEEFLQRRVEVFGRRPFGLTPVLPGILEKLRFVGAWHSTLDDGHFPSAPQIKTRWQGVDSSAIDAIAKPPFDASKAETFLSYAQKLGGSMDSDHVATLCMAHWPRVVSPWYDELRRCARYTSTLGKFTTVDHYFRDTYRPGSLDRFTADQYKSPYLKQAVIRKHTNPISTVARYWRRRVEADVAEALTVMEQAIRMQASTGVVHWSDDIEHPGESAETQLDEKLSRAIQDATQKFTASLPKQADATQSGCLVVNPFGFSRRVGVEVTALSALPNVENAVIAAGASAERKFAVVDVPSMGYLWLQPGSSDTSRKAAEPPLAEDDRQRSGMLFLRNEFFEIGIDPVSGVMKSLHDYRTRKNRLSQQLALRVPGGRGQPGDTWRNPDATAQYSVMAADEAGVTFSNPAVGEIKARGRLLSNDGQPLANFIQNFRVWRGSRVLQLDIELEPLVEPTSDAWNSYFACRFAWSDESASLFASINQTRQQVQKQKLEAPLYVDIENEATQTTVLTGGLPFHRRVGSRMLDTLLIVRGEKERRFRLGVGIDLPFGKSLPEALSFVADRTFVQQPVAAPVPAQSWLFHIDSRSVTPTHWSLITEDGVIKGMRVRLLEGTGRSGRVKLSAFRRFTSARQVNFVGETISECPITDGRIGIDLSAHEWIEVEGRWS